MWCEWDQTAHLIMGFVPWIHKIVFLCCYTDISLFPHQHPVSKGLPPTPKVHVSPQHTQTHTHTDVMHLRTWSFKQFKMLKMETHLFRLKLTCSNWSSSVQTETHLFRLKLTCSDWTEYQSYTKTQNTNIIIWMTAQGIVILRRDLNEETAGSEVLTGPTDNLRLDSELVWSQQVRQETVSVI